MTFFIYLLAKQSMSKILINQHKFNAPRQIFDAILDKIDVLKITEEIPLFCKLKEE